ncbi:putative beta-lactamase [Planomonospora sphaerica]|uniref:Putative beta-lactamase n=1 Tax=Planomonospora sphaerica TaxID=161355 RepID=A0A171DL10_9ACTN|nr:MULTISPECIES: hypothetical protein [Planomonospora]GAT69508.1 putative beta-lactamase [Planomonospora sphaerica]
MTGGAHCGGLEDIDRVMEQPGSWIDALLAVPGRYPLRATTGRSAGGPPEGLPYGWLFWVCRVAGRPAYMAAGWAGQYVLVVPEETLTIVVTGDPEGLRPGSGSGLAVARDLAAALVAEQAR